MPRRDDPDRTRVEIADPWIGGVVAGRYRLELRIAAGGFGRIYRALDLATDRDVAVKVLHASLTADPSVIARFRREGAALAQLRDPHTVVAYEIGEDDGLLFIAMELLSGPSLHTMLREDGTMHWRRVAAIARAVCSSLAEAHALGIVHRDLKPANIHLEGHLRDVVKVLDFGIAKIIGRRDTSDLTNAGEMIGTLDYMAPEQMVGGEITGRTDMFTLGIVMYELLVGMRPFGDSANPAALLTAILRKPPHSPAQLGVELPPDLDRAIVRCLAQDPDDRPSVDGLARLLDRLTSDDDERTYVERAHVERALHDRAQDRAQDRTHDDPAPAEPLYGSGEHTIVDRGDHWSKGERTVDERRRASRFPEAPATTLPGIAPPKKKR